MFVMSLALLTKMYCSTPLEISNVTTYAIVVGLVMYASIYLYVLFYNNQMLSIFNQYVMYIVSIDLLLAGLYMYHLKGKKESEHEPDNTQPLNLSHEDSSEDSASTHTTDDYDGLTDDSDDEEVCTPENTDDTDEDMLSELHPYNPTPHIEHLQEEVCDPIETPVAVDPGIHATDVQTHEPETPVALQECTPVDPPPDAAPQKRGRRAARASLATKKSCQLVIDEHN